MGLLLQKLWSHADQLDYKGTVDFLNYEIWEQADKVIVQVVGKY